MSRSIFRDVPITFNGEVIGQGDVFVTHSPSGVEVVMDAEFDADSPAGRAITRAAMENCSICDQDPLTSVEPAPLLMVDDRVPSCVRCFDEGGIYSMMGRFVCPCDCPAGVGYRDE